MQTFQFSGDPVPPLRVMTVDGKTLPPSRQEIRAFAVAKMEEITRTTVERGANYQHALLDLQEQANAFGRMLAPEDQPEFFRTLEEELHAAMVGLNQRLNKHEAATMTKVGAMTGVYHAVLIVGAVLTFALILLVFRLL